MSGAVAALYDIHGNLPALEAVLDEIRLLQPHRIVVGGDVVPGPFGTECFQTLQRVGIPVGYLRGNGENDVLEAARGGSLARVPEAFRASVRWSAASMGSRGIEEIASWPLVRTEVLPGLGSVFFCHATPADDNELVTRLTPEAALLPTLASVDAGLVICGHTHMQFDRRVGDVRLVNAGSVGMPFGSPGAYWLLVGPDGPELRRTDYDVEAATARLAETGFPGVSAFALTEPPSASLMEERFEAAREPGRPESGI